MSGRTSDYYEGFIAAHHAVRAFYRFHESSGTTLTEYTEGWLSPEAVRNRH